MTRKKVTLQIHHQPTRMDLALLEALHLASAEKARTPTASSSPKISRAALKKFLQNHQVLWCDSPISPAQILPIGTHEIILMNCKEKELEELSQPQLLRAQTAPEDFQIPIVYEDEDLFIINKPTGIPSVPLSVEENRTAVNFALARVPLMAGVGRDSLKNLGLEPGLLHRLDTGTSGLLVFAKTQVEFDRLSHAWKNREVQKYYRAIVQVTSQATALAKAPLPAPTPNHPVRLDSPIGHDADSAKRMIVIDRSTLKNIRGKPLEALTLILAVLRCTQTVAPICQNEIPTIADFEIKIETGVMHQIRCHLSSKGWAILGDKIYRGQPSERLWLHAWRIQIPLKNCKNLILEAELPANWPATSQGSPD